MRRLRAFLLALTVAAGLCGCGRKPLQDNGKLRVVCTLFPYYDFEIGRASCRERV